MATMATESPCVQTQWDVEWGGGCVQMCVCVCVCCVQMVDGVCCLVLQYSVVLVQLVYCWFVNPGVQY